MVSNMNNYAVIENGVVANVIVASGSDAVPGLTLVPANGAQIGDLYQNGTFTKPQPVLTLDDYIRGMDALFDSTAQSRHYDNRITCALRAGYAGPFQAEGKAFAEWMDACYAAGYQILAAVEAGQRQPPASIAALVAELPKLVW